MELFHTSPSEITEINTLGRFGEFLCFADEPYAMTAGEYVTYKLDVDEADIIEAGSLFYQDDADKLAPLVQRVMKLADCSEDDAEELIAQNADAHDFVEPEDAADVSWDIQAITAQAAKILGYRGVSMQDEQGTCYMIDMAGHENELERI